MEPIATIINNSKTFSRSPLGIIALFIILVYGFASLVVGASDNLVAEERIIIVYFMVCFPVLVLCVFGWLVSTHHEKLYTPDDFKNENDFIEIVKHREDTVSRISEIDKTIVRQVGAVLNSEDIVSKFRNIDDLENNLNEIAKNITGEIRRNAFIRIDASKFVGDKNSVFELPVNAFGVAQELFDEIFYLLNGHVRPFTYGYSWVLQNSVTGSVIRSQGMINNTPIGVEFFDKRPLETTGIMAGQSFVVTKPYKATDL